VLASQVSSGINPAACNPAPTIAHNLRKRLALMFSMPLEKVRYVFVDGSGCYGGCQLISTLCQSARSA
jgi:hypothetical protein